jgi:hypothetical protein
MDKRQISYQSVQELVEAAENDGVTIGQVEARRPGGSTGTTTGHAFERMAGLIAGDAPGGRGRPERFGVLAIRA